MDINHIIIAVIGSIALIYGSWGTRLILDQKYATRVGDGLRNLFGTRVDHPDGERRYDRFTRGIGATIFGFTVAAFCFWSLFKVYGIG